MATFLVRGITGAMALSGSFPALGFFGAAGLGAALQSGSYNDKTIGINGAATQASGNFNNMKLVASTPEQSGSYDGGATVNITGVPGRSGCIKVQFHNDSSVQTQNTKFFAWDGGGTTTNAPSGVTVFAYEEADTTWTNIGVTGLTSALVLNDQGTATLHDFYLGISAKPTAIGTKNFSFKFQLEYFGWLIPLLLSQL